MVSFPTRQWHGEETHVGETLRFPLRSPGRLALIGTDFRAGARMKCFDERDFHGLSQFAPESLAISSGAGLSLARHKLRGLVNLPSLRIGIVAVSCLDSGDGPLTQRDRDLLWDAFGMPVFEQLRGRDGLIAARECEVHDGFHFESESFVDEAALRFSVDVARGTCNCGSEIPRLTALVRLRARAAAA